MLVTSPLIFSTKVYGIRTSSMTTLRFNSIRIFLETVELLVLPARDSIELESLLMKSIIITKNYNFEPRSLEIILVAHNCIFNKRRLKICPK